MNKIKEAMKLAILEAKKGHGKVSPNPPVGCVILKNDEILSTGYHEKFGGDHAEVSAISKLSKDKLNDSTIITTLEPCAHEGKTPSCAKLISHLPIKQLVYGIRDINLMAQGGASIIKKAGIKVVEFEELKQELTELVEIFFFNQTYKRPFVAIKVAMSLDGYIADQNKKSKWITQEKSRQKAHLLRKMYDATIIGVNTFIQDNPKLNVRLGEVTPQTVVVIDPKGQGLDKIKRSNLYNNNKRIIWAILSKTEFVKTIAKHDKENKLEYLVFSDSQSLLDGLYKKGIYSCLIEGGASTFAHFFNQNLVNRVYLFYSNKIIGGGINLSQNILNKNLKNPIHIEHIKRICIEGTPDTLVTGLVK